MLDDRRSRDRGSTRQIHHLTNVVEVVEFSLPIVAHYQDVGFVVPDVLALLLKALLDEYLIDSFDVGNDLQTLLLAEYGIATLLGKVQLVR